MKKGILWGILGLALMLSACDSRSGDDPTITFSADPTELVNTVDSLNTTILKVKLEGNTSKIANKTVNIEYDHDLGLLIGHGDYGYLITDANGVATGQFLVDDDVVGPIPIEARVQQYPSVYGTITLNVEDCPEMSFTASDSTIVADGVTRTTLVVSLSSRSNNIAGQTIHFEASSSPALVNTDAQTDANGHAINYVVAPALPGELTITAKLVSLPTVNKSLQLTYE